MSDFSSRLLEWYAIHGRTGMPWQKQKDPYLVWLSEIMLQQTQVETVRDRYTAFLKTFPTLIDLANAPLDAVMSLWAGLGYYSRARNLHACAKIIMQEHGGVFPNKASILEELPGIGPSTAAAIAAFCFDEPISILDANVKRVLARVFAFEQDIKNTKASFELWQLAQSLVPKKTKEMPAYTQALMDFGATVCTPKNPKCKTCSMRRHCQAFIEGKVDILPIQKKKKKPDVFFCEFLLVIQGQEVLMVKRPPSGIWGGLWCLPESAWSKLEEGQTAQVRSFKLAYPEMPAQLFRYYDSATKVLPPQKHIFTHRVLFYQIRMIHLHQKLEQMTPEMQWVTNEKITLLGLPTPIQRFMSDYLQIIF